MYRLDSLFLPNYASQNYLAARYVHTQNDHWAFLLKEKKEEHKLVFLTSGGKCFFSYTVAALKYSKNNLILHVRCPVTHSVV